MRNHWLAAILLSLALALVATPGMADTLDFNLALPTAGSINYAGGAAPLIGSNITVDTVTGLGTHANDGVVRNLFGNGHLFNALLNFTTGNLTSTVRVGAQDFWFFGSGGSISLVGGIDLNNNGILGDAGDIPNGTALFSGAFTEATVSGNSSQFKVSIAEFTDVKDSRLLAFYDFPIFPSYQGAFNISFNGTGVIEQNGGRIQSTAVLSGDIVNTVPEPASLILLGSGLLSIAGFGRKKRS